MDQWKQGNQTRRNKRNCGWFESCWTARDRDIDRWKGRRRDWMMQEEWDDCSLVFFLWGEGKKSLKLSGETRIDETKRTRATCCARGGACWSKEGEAFPISIQRRARPRRHQLTHSLTHTHHQHDVHSLPGVPSPGPKRYRRPGGREGALESTPQCTHPPPPCTAVKTTARGTVTAELCVCVWCARTVKAFDRTVALSSRHPARTEAAACVQSEPAKVLLGTL